MQYEDLHIRWESATKQIKEKDGEARVEKPQSEYHWAKCPRREPWKQKLNRKKNNLEARNSTTSTYERILTFMRKENLAVRIICALIQRNG